MRKLFTLALTFILGTTMIFAANSVKEEIIKNNKTEFVKSPFDGKWDGIYETPNGDVEFSITYKVSGNKITGTISSEYGDMEINEGTVKGNTFEYTMDFNGTEINHKGKLSGNKITITSSGGEEDITLVVTKSK